MTLEDPAYTGRGMAVHVEEDAPAVAAPDPVPAEPSYVGSAQPITSDTGFPSRFSLPLPLPPQLSDDAVYTGVSPAIHVYGTPVTLPPREPIPACQCCAETPCDSPPYVFWDALSSHPAASTWNPMVPFGGAPPFTWNETGAQSTNGATRGFVGPVDSASAPVGGSEFVNVAGPWDDYFEFNGAFEFPVAASSNPNDARAVYTLIVGGPHCASLQFQPVTTGGLMTLWSGVGPASVGSNAVRDVRNWLNATLYSIRWQHGRGRDGVDRVKVWVATDPEPVGWDLVLATGTTPGFSGTRSDPLFEINVLTRFPHVTDQWGWQGMYMTGTCAMGDCSDMCVADFDDFSGRTIAASVGSGLGTASGGAVWTAFGGNLGRTAVAAGVARLTCATGFTGQLVVHEVASPFGTSDDFGCRARLYLFDTATSDPDNVNVSMTFTFAGLSFGWQRSGHVLFIQDPLNGPITLGISSTFWADLSGSAIIEVERVGTTARVKIWDDALSDPGWMLAGTVVIGSAITEQIEASFDGGGASNDTHGVVLDDISFLESCDSGSGSPTTTIFDDFARVIDAGIAGPHTIGTSSSGYAYSSSLVGGSRPAGLIGTDGSSMYVSKNWNEIWGVTGHHDGSDPWAHDLFVMRTRFRITQAPDAATGIGGDFQLSFSAHANLVFHVDDRTWDPVGMFGGAMEIGNGGFSAPGSLVFPKSDWTADAWYVGELQYDVVGGTVKARVYPEGDAPPAWQITRTGGAASLASDDFGILVDTYNGGTTAWQIQSDYIDFVTPGAGGCAECEDPANPGFQIPDFTPGFMPTFRRQIGDPTTRLDNVICTMESAAMVLDWDTRGAVDLWGGELIPFCGKTEAEIAATGTSLDNARQAWLHFGSVLDVRSGQTWDDLVAALAEGRAVILQGDYGAFPVSVRCQADFVDNHAISIYPYRVSDRLLVGDPLCHDFHGVRISDLQAYAEALGAAVFGVQSPQPILFAVSRPWTP